MKKIYNNIFTTVFELNIHFTTVLELKPIQFPFKITYNKYIYNSEPRQK